MVISFFLVFYFNQKLLENLDEKKYHQIDFLNWKIFDNWQFSSIFCLSCLDSLSKREKRAFFEVKRFQKCRRLLLLERATHSMISSQPKKIQILRVCGDVYKFGIDYKFVIYSTWNWIFDCNLMKSWIVYENKQSNEVVLEWARMALEWNVDEILWHFKLV